MLKTQRSTLIQHKAKIIISGTDIYRCVGITVSDDVSYNSLMKHLSFIADDLKEKYNLPKDTQFEVILS